MKRLKEPMVSIIMPAYNAQRFLHEAMESILSQTFTEFEFLIMDDGSTDSTWQILGEYAHKDRRIKLFQQKNQGVAVSLNYLFSVAQGDLIARMDADDISHPERIQHQVNYLCIYPEVGMVSTARLAIAPNGLFFCYICPPDNQALLADLFTKRINLITHGSVMMRKTILTALNEPPYSLIQDHEFEDIDLWKRLIKHTTLAVIKTPLYFMRVYSGSVTNLWCQNKSTQGDQNKNSPKLINTVKYLDYKASLLLKKKLVQGQSYECYLNARALYSNRKYVQAFALFSKVLFCKKNNLKSKSFFFWGLVIFGPIGLFIYRKIRNKPDNYYQH